MYRISEKNGVQKLKVFHKHRTSCLFYVGDEATLSYLAVPMEVVGTVFQTGEMEGLVGFFLDPKAPLDASNALHPPHWHEATACIGGKRGSPKTDPVYAAYWEFPSRGKMAILVDERGRWRKAATRRFHRATKIRRDRFYEFVAYGSTRDEAAALLEEAMETHLQNA